jgi:hypothetical protein
MTNLFIRRWSATDCDDSVAVFRLLHGSPTRAKANEIYEKCTDGHVACQDPAQLRGAKGWESIFGGAKYRTGSQFSAQ